MSEADTAGRLAEHGLDALELPMSDRRTVSADLAAAADAASMLRPRAAPAAAIACWRANTGPPPSTT